LVGEKGAEAAVYKSKGVVTMISADDIIEALEREARRAGHDPYRAETLAREAAYCAFRPSAPLSKEGMNLYIALGGGRKMARKEVVASSGW